MDALTQWEITVTLFLQGLGTWLLPVMLAVTWLGSENFYILLLTILYWCVDTGLGLRMGIILMLSNSTNAVFKILFHSPRPYWIDSRVQAYSSEPSFGLPSGHSQNAMSIWGVMAAGIKRKTGWVAALIILLMGLSRMYLGVHFLRDVILGWVIGALLLILMIMFEKPLVKWFKSQNLAYRLGFSLTTALVMVVTGLAVHAGQSDWMLPETWYQTALQAAPDNPIDPFAYEGIFTVSGTWFGMLSGAALLVGGNGAHDPHGPLVQRVLRYLLGITGLLILYLGLGALFPRTSDLVSYGLRFLRYALIGLWVIWLAPMVFIRLGLAKPRSAV